MHACLMVDKIGICTIPNGTWSQEFKLGRLFNLRFKAIIDIGIHRVHYTQNIKCTQQPPEYDDKKQRWMPLEPLVSFEWLSISELDHEIIYSWSYLCVHIKLINIPFPIISYYIDLDPPILDSGSVFFVATMNQTRKPHHSRTLLCDQRVELNFGVGYVRSHCTSRIGATEMDYFTKFSITNLAHWWQTNFGAPFVGMFFLTTKRQPKPGNNRWRSTETGGSL